MARVQLALVERGDDRADASSAVEATRALALPARGTGPATGPAVLLSEREESVLSLVAQAMPNKKIARALAQGAGRAIPGAATQDLGRSGCDTTGPPWPPSRDGRQGPTGRRTIRWRCPRARTDRWPADRCGHSPPPAARWAPRRWPAPRPTATPCCWPTRVRSTTRPSCSVSWPTSRSATSASSATSATAAGSWPWAGSCRCGGSTSSYRGCVPGDPRV